MTLTVYELKENETTLIQSAIVGDYTINKVVAYPMIWQVTRVATGWIYQETTGVNPKGYFVPLTTYQNPTI